MFSFWHSLMGLWMLLPVIIIVLVIYLIIKNSDGDTRSSDKVNRKKDALDILDERYASGEISEEEYQNKKDKINKR